MATTTTQSRLLTLARFHQATQGRWPDQTRELFHHAVTPAHAVSLYALRPGYGYCVAWCSAGQDGVNFYQNEADAITWLDRRLHDLRTQGHQT
jgi:hypothetical protein